MSARLHAQALSDRFDFRQRNARILLSEQAEHRHFDAIGFGYQRLELQAFARVHDAAAIETHGRRDVRPARSEESDESADTEPDDADAARIDVGHVPQMSQCRIQVRFDSGVGERRKRLAPLGVVVRIREKPTASVVEIGCDRHVALARETAAHVLDVRVHAKGFLCNDECRKRPLAFRNDLKRRHRAVVRIDRDRPLVHLLTFIAVGPRPTYG
jgi:hypothetical protein